MHEWLQQHPAVFMSNPKEPCFFAFEDGSKRNKVPVPDQFIHTLSGYQALFAAAGNASVIGESSTLYLQIPEAPARIKALIPDVKMVAILRDPSDRAFSHFLQHRFVCAEPEAEFRDALNDLPNRRAKNWTVNYDYVDPGFYAKHLRCFDANFEPEQIKVVLFDDLMRNPTSVMSDLCGFLGMQQFKFDTSQIHNAGGSPRNNPVAQGVYGSMRKLSAIGSLVPERLRRSVAGKVRDFALEKPTLQHEERARLIDIYRDDILALENRLGRDLSRWLEVEKGAK